MLERYLSKDALIILILGVSLFIVDAEIKKMVLGGLIGYLGAMKNGSEDIM